MSVSAMEKLNVVIAKDEADALCRRLMRLRAVSLLPVPGDLPALKEGDPGAVRAHAARVDAVLPELTKRSRRKKAVFARPNPVSFEEFRRGEGFERAERTVNETERIGARRTEIRALVQKEEALMTAVLPYLDYPLALELKGTREARLFLGSLPLRMSTELVRMGDELGFVPDVISQDRNRVYFSLLVHRKEAEAVLSALRQKGFEAADFSGAAGTAAQVYDAAEERRFHLREEDERLSGQLTILADNLSEVEILSDMEHTTLLCEENKRQLAGSDRCAFLSGWCPVSAREKVTATLEKFTAAYEFTPPEPDEEPPILLRNNAYARNFEWVVGMYAYPKYGRFDPTFIMSIFYFIIFGLMFADAGYGLLLSAACFLAVRFLHPREGMKRFLLMFGYCGISCMICGVLFGAYFGDFPLAFLRYMLKYTDAELPNLALLPGTAANVAVLFDPLQNPMAFLLLALGVGAVHLLSGMAVRACILCRDGKWLDALFDIGSYYLLFAGIGVIFLARVPGICLTIAGVLAILATQGRNRKGVAGRLLGGFGGLYNLVGYVSDLLSYSRILALGLAAGIIGQVVNILATLGGPTFVGWVLMLPVFLLGHVLNLAINVLGTFVHTSRLQYIEFFGKFYEDGGTPFRPMTPADRYTDEVEAPEETPAETGTV
ncbi:MAG: hypothetical protein MR343_00645 [Clostridia bacterium]|nr:hypothetical protein [Clostridia bacterium]